MNISRRTALAAGGLALAAVGSMSLLSRRLAEQQLADALPTERREVASGGLAGRTMRYRDFGATGMKVSEVGFGSWAIGGRAYGRVARAESIDALAHAEELGCNFVDTAMVYGDAEEVIGEFLVSRRGKWLVASKYSGQKPGLQATLETQLRRLRVDTIDFYQIHWAPGRDEHALYEDLYRAKKSGKVRAVGVSLKNEQDIDHILDATQIDGFQIKFSLLDPYPFLARVARIREHKPAVVVRSSLREGFLAGKFNAQSTFTDPDDQRSKLTRAEIVELVDAAERFRFLEGAAGSMAIGAARYPLSFPEVSTVLMGTKSGAQAQANFGAVPGATLPSAILLQVYREQQALGLHSRGRAMLDWLRRKLPR